jgi:hypothetical protein
MKKLEAAAAAEAASLAKSAQTAEVAKQKPKSNIQFVK